MAKLDMIGIVCKDMAKAAAFYRELGLPFEEPGDEPYIEVEGPGGLRISLNALTMVKEIDPHYEEPKGFRMGLAFKTDSPAEVDSLYNSLTSKGYASHKAPFDAFWGQRYAQVLDPDGNVVDLFAPL
ncbi:MAG: VOC family protein [Armatimonadetes bacterium]|nr:VOC family protein [Armatimonadota bacterium]